MKIANRAILVLASVLLAWAIATQARAAVSFDFLYSNLSPAGTWMVSGSYGRVWQPSAYSPGWNPYYDGHWVDTDLGWTWVSDYPWGAIPYHYGTWVAEPQLGWVWVPGTTWAPAWVVFRSGPDYVGWAPVKPGFTLGVSYTSSEYDDAQFVFVPTGNFAGHRIRNFAVSPKRTKVIIERTTIINNTIRVENNIVVNRGPRRDDIERACGYRIAHAPIEGVHGTTTGKRFDRREVRVDKAKVKKGIHASDMVAADRPLPSERGRSAPGHGSKKQGGGQERQSEKQGGSRQNDNG